MAKRTAPSETYLTRARTFAEAIDLAANVRRAAHVSQAAMTKFEQKLKTMALDPEPPFAKVESLKQLENNFSLIGMKARALMCRLSGVR
jgi:hypothetical protein